MDDLHNINAVNIPTESENTDKCCPNGNSTTGHSAICWMMQYIVPNPNPNPTKWVCLGQDYLWLLVYLRKFLWNTLNEFGHFLPFNNYWFAMTGRTCFGSATWNSEQNSTPEKTIFQNLSGELWRNCRTSWLVHLSPCQVVRVRAPVGALCSFFG